MLAALPLVFFTLRRRLSTWTTILMVVGVVSVAQAQSLDPNWTVRDIGGGIKPSFDFGPDGRIHVMGLTEAFGGFVWHAEAESIDGPWEPTTLDTGYFYGPGDLRVDAEGVAHLAWHDHDAQDAAHASVSETLTEITIAATPGTHDGWDNAIAFTSNGDVRMSSIFPSAFGASTSLVVGELVGDTWESEAIATSGAAMYGLNTTLDVDSNDRSHILYTLADDWTGPGSVNYVVEGLGGWEVRSIESGQNVGRFPSISIDANDQVHAAWINVHTDDRTKADVRYATLEDEWQIETVATLDSVRLGFSDARKLVSLEVDSEGNPHLAYGDQDSVTYATRENDGWLETTVVQTEAPILNGLVVLRLDPNDDPGIAFWRPVALPQQGIVSLAVLDIEEPSLLGDFDDDGLLTALDVDAIKTAFGSDDLTFDLNGDLVVDVNDHNYWVTDVAKTLFGDANLDRSVDFADFLILSQNFETSGGWAVGNFDGGGNVAFRDFLLLSQNFGQTAAAATVPEPTAWSLGVLGFVSLLRRRRFDP